MARPGLLNHRKFRRLCDSLALPEPYVLGLLECLWSVAYEAGDELVGDARDVELACRWPGERGMLASALASAGGEHSAGFVEEVPGQPGIFRVHDLFDHAPEYVRRRAQREEARRASGKTISDLRRDAVRSRWDRERAEREGVGVQPVARRAAS